MVAIPQICYNSAVTCLDRPSDRVLIKKSGVMQNFWDRLHDDRMEKFIVSSINLSCPMKG